MNHVVTICLVIVGLINILPLVGVLSADKMMTAYDIELASNELIILMRHRALMFGLLGGFILVSAFNPNLQVSAMVMAFISMAGFVILTFLDGPHNTSISKIVLVDVVGLVILSIAVVFKYWR